MTEKLTFVLGGGGSRGALQAGGLYALLESGLQPDLLVGTSIGAVNSAFIARHGFTRESLDRLRAAWLQASKMDLLPANYIRLALRSMLRRSLADPSHRIREFMITSGLTPELTFADLPGPRLVIVSADLNTGQPVLHGDSQDENVLEGLLLSTALPPWAMPVRKQGRLLMDGGVLSNLPVEPALRLGATRIYALDLTDTRELFGAGQVVANFLDRLSMAVEKRQSDLEMELAAARGVPVTYLPLVGSTPIPYWDFQHTEGLLEEGYNIVKEALGT